MTIDHLERWVDEPFLVPRSPTKVGIEITGRCNLRCAYCYFHDDAVALQGEVPTDEWLKFFDELGDCAILKVSLAGGEPFLRRDLRVLIQGIVANRMRFDMSSNGAFIEDELAAYLADTGRCDGVQVSVDGSCPETHDSLRGTGSFLGAMRGIQVLKRNGVPVHVQLTIHHRNVGDLEAVVRFLLEDLELPLISTNAACLIGACKQNPDGVAMTAADHQRAIEVMYALHRKYGDRIMAPSGPLHESKSWTKILRAAAERSKPFPGAGALSLCPMLQSTIGVRADGAYMPCPSMRQTVVGRINRDKLIDIWQNSPVLARVRQRRSIPLSGFDFCTGCNYLAYCYGGCPALALACTGEINQPDPTSCIRQFIRDGGNLDFLPERDRGAYKSSDGRSHAYSEDRAGQT